MRLIHTFNSIPLAERYWLHLAAQEIYGKMEVPDVGEKVTVWVLDEDDVDRAEKILAEFLEDPENAKFSAPETVIAKETEEYKPEPEIKFKKTKRHRVSTGGVTLFLLISCLVLYLWSAIDEAGRTAAAPGAVRAFQTDQVKKVLQFDYPTRLHARDLLIERYGTEWITNPNELQPTAKLLVVKYQSTPQWKGLYDEYLLRHRLKALEGVELPWSASGELFERIKKGEVWRLVTPALLHGGLFHIFFNLVWLMTLGPQMEGRMGSGRFLLFCLITAAFSNVCQYLMGGYNFLGLSGVICAMLGFIWMRQKIAAWEGYLLQPGTVAFISIFVLGLAGFQTFSFFRELANPAATAAFGIANTAHITGGLIGILLARLPIFSWRTNKRL